MRPPQPPIYEPLAPGDPPVIGGYRVLARLGAGGMGRVFLAATQSGRRLAIKVVRPEFADDPEFRRRFRQEIAAAERVHHLHIAPVIDSDPDGSPPWLATAHVPAPSLAKVVAEAGPLPAGSLRVLASGVAQALQAIHQAGVIHRDLKPSNVLLAADGPRVIDFGIARAADSTPLTRTGVRVGTPHFMAPEQALGRPATPAIDVFAFGVLVFFAATGRSPFGEGPDAAVLFRIAHEEPDLTGGPDQLRPLIESCLAKDPSERPALRDIIDQLQAPPPSPDQPWLPEEVTRTLAPYSAPPPPPPATAPPGTPPSGAVPPGAVPPGQPPSRFDPLGTPATGTSPTGPQRPARRLLYITMGAAVAALLLVPAVIFAALTDRDPERDAAGTAGAPTTTSAINSNPPLASPPDPSLPGSSSPSTPVPQPTGKPTYLEDLTPRGDSLAVGTWSMAGKKYPKSLGLAPQCTGAPQRKVHFDLPGEPGLFVSVVGLSDTAKGRDRNTVVDFLVYVDRNGDDEFDEDEQVASRGGSYGYPATIQVDLGGADSISLVARTSDLCFPETAAFVWGTPRVYPR